MSDAPTEAAYRVADQIGEAFSSLDSSNFGPIFAEDVQIWHNLDNKTQNKAENIAYMANFLGHCREVAFTDIKRTPLPRGYLQQHMTVGILKNGAKFAIPVCHVAEVENGLLKRIDEYFDPTPYIEALKAA